jgi:hypothetical protein
VDCQWPIGEVKEQEWLLCGGTCGASVWLLTFPPPRPAAIHAKHDMDNFSIVTAS